MGSLGSDVLRSVGFGGLLDDERELLLELRRCLGVRRVGAFEEWPFAQKGSASPAGCRQHCRTVDRRFCGS
jgi:hypothetical protein